MSTDRTRFATVAVAFVAMTFIVVAPAWAQALYDAFIKAVAEDRRAEVRSLLARGMDANTVDPRGEPVLVVALAPGGWRPPTRFWPQAPRSTAKVRRATRR